MATTAIEWAERVWNPLTGCTEISPGCKNCYARVMSKRLKAMGQRKYANEFELTLHPEETGSPLHWRKPSTIFVNSMSDLFHKDVPEEFIQAVFATMRAAHWHRFIVLTKRADRLADMAPRIVWPPNVWITVSVEDQRRADERVPLLLQVPAAVLALSMEPLLGPVDLDAIQIPGEREGLRFSALREQHEDRYGAAERTLSWVIVGGESGPGARSMDIAWARSIVQQCKAAGVPCFVKQLGARPYAVAPLEESPRDRTRTYFNHGKKGEDMRFWPSDLQVREFPAVLL